MQKNNQARRKKVCLFLLSFSRSLKKSLTSDLGGYWGRECCKSVSTTRSWPCCVATSIGRNPSCGLKVARTKQNPWYSVTGLAYMCTYGRAGMRKKIKTIERDTGRKKNQEKRRKTKRNEDQKGVRLTSLYDNGVCLFVSLWTGKICKGSNKNLTNKSDW